MNKNLLDRVSVEKIDALVDALSGVISDMRITGENSETCFCNEAWKSHTNLTHPVKVF